MGKYYSGINGSLSVNGARIGRVRSWQITATADALPTTTLGDHATTYRYGTQSASGGCTVFYHALPDGTVESRPLLSSLLTTSAVPVDQTYRLKLGSDDRSIECDALITSVDLGAEAGGVMQADISFVVTGSLIEASLGGT